MSSAGDIIAMFNPVIYSLPGSFYEVVIRCCARQFSDMYIG